MEYLARWMRGRRVGHEQRQNDLLVAANTSMVFRSKKDVTERLHRLIIQIRKIQEPRMKGDGPGDVLVVRSPFRGGRVGHSTIPHYCSG